MRRAVRLRFLAPWALLALALPLTIAVSRCPRHGAAPTAREGGEAVPGEVSGARAPLSGRVRDGLDRVLVGASVRAHALLGPAARLAGEADSDLDGLFAFPALPIGLVAVEASAPGHATEVALVDLGPGGLSEVDLVLAPAAPVSGRVLDETETPVAGASVCAVPSDRGPVPELERRCTTTDGAGDLLLADLRPGRMTLEVTGPGLLRAIREGELAPAEGLVLQVRRLGEIAGTVRRPDGSAAAGAVVTVAGSGLWPPRAVRTDESGRFLAESVPAGWYELEARLEGLTSGLEQGVEVAAGGRVTVDLDLAPGVTLTGIVLSGPEGSPVEGATVVVAVGQLAAAPVVARSGAEGRFALHGLVAGEHFVTVWASGLVPETSRAVEAPGHVEIRLGREATVRGRVVDDRGFPVAGALVEPEGTVPQAPRLIAGLASFAPSGGGELGVVPGLELVEPPIDGPVLVLPSDRAGDPLSPPTTGGGRPPAPETSWPVASGRDGSFEVRGLPAGDLVLLARGDGGASGRSEPLVLAAGGTVEGVEIRLVPGVAVTGRVVDERGFPLSGALVSLRTDASRERTVALSRADGTFELGAASGLVVLEATLTGRAPRTLELELGAGPGRTDLEVVLAEASRRLRGRVVGDRGFPIVGASVTGRSAADGGLLAVRATSGSDGGFELVGLAAGTVVVEAEAPGRSPAVANAPPGEDVVVLRLGASGGLALRPVEAWSGAPVESCEAELLPAAGPARRARCAGGLALFEDLPAGPATARVSAPGLARAVLALEVVAGLGATEPAAEVRVELETGATVRGVVLDSAGEPVAGARVSLEPLPRARAGGASGPWAVTAADGRFELEGLSRDRGGTVHARHGVAGAGAAEVRPLWPEEEPEVVVVLEGGEGRVRRAGGVAVDIAGRRGRVTVVAVCPGSRAERAGLRPGDVLRAVDGETVASRAAAARALAGPRGTAVLLEVTRAGADRTLLIEREIVER